MGTTIARYPSPTFVLQGAVSDTDPQTAASYNTFIAETAAQRADFVSANLNGITEYGVIAGATTTYTPAAFAAWQTFGRLQLDVSVGGADCTINPPPSPKNGDIFEILFPAHTSQELTYNKRVKPAASLQASPGGAPATLPYFVMGTWRYAYSTTFASWLFIGSQSIAREGFATRLGGSNSLGALPGALAGTVRTIAITSTGVLSWKSGDTLFARLSGIHTRTNAATGVDDNSLSYYLAIRRNGVDVQGIVHQFPNEEKNRVMFNAYASQNFQVALELAYTFSSPLDGNWTVVSGWTVNGASQVVNPQRAYALTTTCEVQRGCDFQ